jgi:hypothetical protein
MRTYPHCDARVLHAPGECEYCDEFASDLQEQRIDQRINFTGHDDPDLLPDPATQARPVETINRWGGNVAVPKDAETVRDWFGYEVPVEEPVGVLSPECKLPPRGWYCTRGAGHDGPCAAWPTRWTRIRQWLHEHVTTW